MATTRTLLDSASLADLSYVLDQRRLPRSYSWAYQCAYETTCFFLETDSVRLGPALTRARASGVNAILRTSLAPTIRAYKVDARLKLGAMTKTQEWAARLEGKNALREFILGSPLDSTGRDVSGLVRAFLESEKRYWPDTCAELDGPFDEVFTVQIAAALDMSATKLRQLHNTVTENFQILANPRKNLGAEQTLVLENAFLASTLLRGYYKDIYYRHGQILHHPVRSAFLASGVSDHGAERFTPTNSVRALAAVLIEASMRQHHGVERIECYAASLRTVRYAAKQGRVNLNQVDDDDTALRDAADSLIRLGVRSRSQAADKWIEVFFGGGVTIATTFALAPWEALGVGLGAAVASGVIGVGASVGKATMERRYRLSRLGKAAWGRLIREAS